MAVGRGASVSCPVRYRAVFFDVGETLVHPAPSFPELFAQVLRTRGPRVLAETVRDRLRAP